MNTDAWRILLIDDNPDDRADVRQMLLRGSTRRYHFLEADLGAAGVKKIHEELAGGLDCVLLDYHLPDMNAEEVLAALRGNAELPPCPVLVLTGAQNLPRGSKLIRDGAMDYIGKEGTTPQSLTRAVENAVERYALLRERAKAEVLLTEAQRQLRDHSINLEKIIAERTVELRATNEQLETFVYSVAHDLRAPLRSMMGFSQLLLADYGPVFDDAGKQMFKGIQKSSEFMDKLLLDLLDFGRVSRAEMELVPVAVHKAWNIARFQNLREAEASHALIEVIGVLPTVIAHETTLEQCLTNLLSNALKFVAPGVKPHICLRVEELPGDRVRLWVTDNGIGIAREYHERAFRVFERLHGERYGGTGIGLSIVRKGVERMRGEVGLESEAGKGCRFWIELAKAE